MKKEELEWMDSDFIKELAELEIEKQEEFYLINKII